MTSWCIRVKKKKEIVDQFDKHSCNTNSCNNAIENKLLEFLDDRNYTLDDDNDDSDDQVIVCRVCLNTASEIFLNIHMKTTSIGTTFAEKINIFTEIEQIRKDDGLPQHICKSCVTLLDNVFKFKTLCEHSDSELRKRAVDSVLEEAKKKEYDSSCDDDYHELIDVNEVVNDNDVIEKNLCVEKEQTIEISTDNEEESNTEIKNEGNLKENSEKTERFSSKENKEGTETPEKLSEVEEFIHQCEVCGIVCYNEKSLKKHLHTHKIKRPHRCYTCSKEFRTKISLRIHMRSHTGERPYVCEACGKTFKTWSAVATHRAVHSEVKEFRCNQCTYQANTKANLQIHSRIHTGVQPYACNQCHLKFSTASNRSKHVRNIHEKKRLHKCTSCDRSFFSKETLRKHKVIHTGLKPYICPECPMTYSWYNGLQKHMKTQHEKVKIPTEKFYFDQIYT